MAASAARSKVVHARLIQAQFEPYQRSLVTRVVATSAAPRGRQKTGAQWVLELADTVLFPAGGGQPSDRGTVQQQRDDGEAAPVYDVVDVERQDDRVLHYVRGGDHHAWAAGTAVRVELDWQRRFDHMQQHSGQHLLSALAQQTFGWKTASWNLGDDVCYIDFEAAPDQQPIQPAALAELQRRANDVIRDARPLDVRVDLMDAPSSATDAKFGVRTVNISGVDDHNRCCGTHVRHTGHLQAVVLAPRSAELKDSKVYFWAGERVAARLADALLREQALNVLLTTAPSSHVAAVERLQKERRQLNNKIKHLEDEFVALLADKLLRDSPGGPVFTLLRQDDELTTLHKIAAAVRQASPAAVLLLVSAAGPFVVAGPDDIITPDLGRNVAQLFATKGGGKKGIFQGNIPQPAIKAAIAKMPDAQALLLAACQTAITQPVTSSS